MGKLNISIKTKLFTIMTLIILLSVSTIGWFGFYSAKEAYLKSAILTSKAEVKSLSNQIKGLLDTIPEDVVYNEGFYALEKFLVWEDLKEPYKIKEWKTTYELALIDYLRNKKLYYQVRLLDLNGYEKMVLKYDEKTGTVKKVAPDKLQDKSAREYYKKAIKLKGGEFYISVMNLNVEHGTVERPFIPVVRYSTPIIDRNGDTKGVLILNFSANKILNMIKDIKTKDKTNSHNYFLLNESGDYLYTDNIDKRWGFQLGRSYKFSNDFGQDIFQQFENHDKVTIHKDGKIISMLKIYPNKQGNPRRFWYLVTSVDEDIALSSLEEFIQTFFIILFVVLAVGLFFINRYITFITNPITKITSQLNGLSLGKIKKVDILYNASDEIGEMVNSTRILVDAIETTIKQANLVSNGDFTKEITLLSENDALGLAIQNMTKRLKEITSLAKNLSVGNYETKVIAKSGDDELGLALIDLVKYLETITKVAESIAVGEIDIKYKAQGSNDRLGRAILQMIKYLKTILKQANAITNEDFSNNIESKGKNDELGNALITMTDMLGASSIKTKDEIWLSEGLGSFSDNLTGIDKTLELSKEAITLSSRYVGASSGAIYTLNSDNNKLNLISSFAFTNRENLSNQFGLGDGIIGQVALEREPILLQNIRGDQFEIQTGTTISKPKEVFAFPLIHEGELFGVTEIMTLKPFTALQKKYLLKTANIFATVLHTTAQNAQIKTLLEESRQAYEELQLKSEEMQIQSEELKTSNDQMEYQQQQLQMQSANLQIKNTEIEKAKAEIDKKAADLEASNQYKSEFLANMSHELRTPLNSIILLSSLLSKNNKANLNDGDIQKANVINESGNELLRLINDILDLSKIESGKMELIIDKIDTNNLVKHYEEIFSHSAKDKGIEFKVEDNVKGLFYNDKDRLGQVVRNLISNALKFTKEGSVTLKVDSTEDEKLPIKISVVDTGMGIPKDKQELIFKAFTQADGSTSRQFGGTGLGLSISTELSHLMKGSIELESEVGKGSIFSILLPNLKDSYNGELVNAGYNSSKQEIKSGDTVINKKENIAPLKENFLVIEDDKVFANILKETIEDHGAKVFIANTGQDGLKLAAQHNIVGAIVDIGLPDMCGIDVIKELKSNPLTQNINIQVISGKDKDEHNLNEIKIDGYLQKPVSSAQIQNAISNIELIHENIKSILIVEDDLMHQKAISDYLSEDNDYNIVTASSVKEANSLCDQQYFDIAIVDLGLGDGSGTEVCQYITQNHKDTAIMIYTGRDLSAEEADYLNNISDEIIIKNPNSHEKLKDEIERFLEEPHETVNERFKPDVTIKEYDYSNVNIDDIVGKNVLIVDDDIKNIFVLTSALQEYDMQISHAKNGQEALDSLRDNPDIDIVLMDIMMPIMNGYEAIEAIRADENIKHLPVIAVTAKAMEQDKQDALNSGADDFLTKPIDLDKLSSMMALWINK